MRKLIERRHQRAAELAEYLDDLMEHSNAQLVLDMDAEIERLQLKVDDLWTTLNLEREESAKLQTVVDAAFMAGYEWAAQMAGTPERGYERFKMQQAALQGGDEHKHVWAKDGRGRYCVKADCPIYGDAALEGEIEKP